MGPEVVSAIIAGIGALITAYYSHQQTLPERKKRKVCESLVRLRDALNAIGHTGQSIGGLMTDETFTPGNYSELNQLIHLLEEQNLNLQSAEAEFRSLAAIFDIHAPELNPLIIHLRGKSDRIEIIYSIASTIEVRSRLNESLAPWEKGKNKFLVEPRQLMPTLQHSEPDVRIKPVGLTIEADENFKRIIDCIPQLTTFIKTHCAIKDLS